MSDEEGTRRRGNWEGWIDYNAPVIGEGTIGGKRWSFYARGSVWAVQIAEREGENPEEVGITTSGWIVEGELPGEFEAGWMTPKEAWVHVERVFERYQKGELVLVRPTMTGEK